MKNTLGNVMGKAAIKVILGAASVMHIIASPLLASEEVLMCEVQPLEAHGFIQLSEYDEYVCQNTDDITDFVVLADEYKEMELGDTVRVGLNEYGEVEGYEVIAN